MKLTDIPCNQDYVLENARCQLKIQETIEISTGRVELQQDDSLAFCANGRKYRFSLLEMPQAEQTVGLLRRGFVCMAEKLRQFEQKPLFTLRMIFFSSWKPKGSLDIVLENKVFETLKKYKEKRELVSLLAFREGERTYFAYTVTSRKEPEKPKKDENEDAEVPADIPEDAQQPEQQLSEKSFCIYGNGYELQVCLVTEGEDEYLSGRWLKKSRGAPKFALQLAEGKLNFTSQKKRAAQKVKEELSGSPGYLDLWNQYSDQEEDFMLRRARKIGILKRTESSLVDKEKLVIFLAEPEKDHEDVLELLQNGDSLAFTKEKPLYLAEPEMTKRELRGEKARRKDQNSGDSQKEITMRIVNIEKQSARKIELEPQNREDGISGEILSNRMISLSIKGYEAQIDRRQKSRDRILNGEAANPNIAYVIEGIPYLDENFHQKRRQIQELSPRVREKVFRNDPTLKQREAIRIALNTPDIAIIQGPPGTGKTTVITGIIERLNEIANKSRDCQGEVLVTSLQHDAVRNIQNRLHINSLPTVKFGKQAGMDESLDESVEKWCEENAEKLRQKHFNLQERDVEKELARSFEYYLRTPSNQNALKFLQCAEIAAPQQEIQTEIQMIRQELEPQEALEQDTSAEEWKQLLQQIRQLRTTKTGFADDGRETAKALRQFLKKELLSRDDPVLQTLKKACRIRDDAITPEFLGEMAQCRESLLERCAPEPFYRKPQPRTDIVELYNRVRDLVKPTLGQEDRILAQYLEQLEENQEAVRTSLKKYCFVYSATLQQSAGEEIRAAKGKNLEYDTVIVDEAARANPCDLMISMAQARSRIILVGDHRQLPHIYDEEVFQELQDSQNVQNQADIKISMFKHLLDMAKKLEEKDGILRHVTLDMQYRMHPELGQFVSEQFYEPYGEGFKSPLPAEKFAQRISPEPFCWLDVKRNRGPEVYNRGGSRSRACEAKEILKRLEAHLKDPSCQEMTFGVISFYRAQVSLLEQEIRKSDVLKEAEKSGRLRVGTVDAFQGMEFDVIYLSVVRSEVRISEADRQKLSHVADILKDSAPESEDEPEEIKTARTDKEVIGQKCFGFITSENRLCVALSRQKRLLVIVGSSELLGTTEAGIFRPWKEAAICLPAMVSLYEKCKEKGAVQECGV